MPLPRRDAVRAANEAFYRAFESLDLDAMRACWARHAQVSCVHPGWDLVIGLEAVMQSFRDIFANSSAVRFDIDSPLVTAGIDAGWVVCREVLHTTVSGSPIENVLTAMNTFVLEEGEWRVSHHHAGPLMTGRPRATRSSPSVLH